MYPNAIRCSFQQSTLTTWPTHETVCSNVPLMETYEYSAGPFWLAYHAPQFIIQRSPLITTCIALDVRFEPWLSLCLMMRTPNGCDSGEGGGESAIMQQSRGTNAAVGMAASYLADKIKLSLKNFSNTWREYSVKLISQYLSRAIACKNDQLTTICGNYRSGRKLSNFSLKFRALYYE